VLLALKVVLFVVFGEGGGGDDPQPCSYTIHGWCVV